MKYNFNINQYAIIKNNLNIDVIDACIFDYIRDFALSGNAKAMISLGKQFYWIKWSKIASDNPILGIKTRQGVASRLLKLRNAGLIEPHIDNKTIQMSWFCFGENYNKMFFLPDNENIHPDNETLQPLTTKLYSPDNETLHNYNINHYSINNNKPNTTSKAEIENFENEKPDWLVSQLESEKEKNLHRARNFENEINIWAQVFCDETFLFQAAKMHQIERSQIYVFWSKFETFQKTVEKEYNSIKDLKSHFLNWLKIEVQNSKKIKKDAKTKTSSSGKNGHQYDANEAEAIQQRLAYIRSEVGSYGIVE